MATVKMEMTPDQAAALTRMLDLATRIHLGQFWEIESLALSGDILRADGRELTFDELDKLRHYLGQISNLFGFPAGSSHGIYSQHVNKDAKRGYELKKVIEKALAEWNEPNPKGMRGVNYDGIIARCTDDPAPVVEVRDDLQT